MEAKMFKGVSIVIEDDLVIYIFKSGHRGYYFVVEDEPYDRGSVIADLMIIEQIYQKYKLDIEKLAEKLKEI